jgi:ribonuclease III
MDLSRYVSDSNLLSLALTHRSYSRDSNNERLEFLGDSVLGMLVTEWLLSQGNHNEGELSKVKAQLVSTSHLATVARTLELPAQLRLSDSQRHERNNPRLLASAVEAVIGAAYTCGGLPAARLLVTRYVVTLSVQRDYKTELQERTQPRPVAYTTIRRVGPAHDPEFTVSVSTGTRHAYGSGPSVKAALQDAARAMLAIL